MTSKTERLPVIHIGFNKCGSTTLQNALFARHPEVVSLGEPFKQDYPDIDEAMFNAMDSCHRDPARRVPFDLEKGRRLWRTRLASLDPGKVPVYSKESLTRPWFYAEPGDSTLAERLHALVGPARIVVMGRHQIKLLESLYITRTKGHQYQDPEEWIAANSGNWAHIYRYHAFARSYARAFGRGNVGVFLLEDLVSDVEGFARALCGFIGIDAEKGVELLRDQRWNTRTSQRAHIYSKLRKRLGPDIRLSRFAPKPVREAFSSFLGGGKRARVELPAHWLADMESYYREDNRELASEWGLPLGKYGYPL